MQPPTIPAEPYQAAPDTWIIPQYEPADPTTMFTINSMVIASSEPVIVDTGAAINRERWMEQVFSIVEPTEVRWVYISHSDRDHVGNLDAVLAACPHATVLSTMWGVRGLLGDGPPPVARMRWINDGESFDAGDRTLIAVRPPVWDSTGTRGLYDPTTGVYWAADCFGSLFTHPVHDAADLDHEFWRETYLFETRSYCEWHSLLDERRFHEHVDRSASLRPSVVASAHGPVLRGAMVEEAYDLMRQLPNLDRVPDFGQAVLDDMVAAVAAASQRAA